MSTKQAHIALLVASVMAGACVHSQVARTGRLRLGEGAEGRAPVLQSLPLGYEEVAQVSVKADGAATQERLERHLARKASIMGCDGLVAVRFSADSAHGSCVRNREPVRTETGQLVVARPPRDLVARAERAGAQGDALLVALAQSQSRQGAARAWPLRWYLESYPESPFRAEVEALFVRVPDAVDAPSTVRASSVIR